MELDVLEKYPHIHTNRELELMLAGLKPLAVFSGEITLLPDETFIPEKQFAPSVESGDLVRDEFLLVGGYSERLDKIVEFKNVLFALKSEQWRILAMKNLLVEFNVTGQWNETLERMQGKLLGYTDEENDLWCNRYMKNDLRNET